MSTDITLIPKQVGEAVVWEAPPSEGGTGGGNGGGGNESPPPPDGNTPNPPSSKKRRKTKGLVIWLAIALVLAVVFETVHYNGYVKAEGFWGGFFSSFLWFGVIPTIILLVPLI